MNVKKITLLGFLTAIALVFSFLESFIDLSFIVPGVKIGIANSVAVLLIAAKNAKGAAAVSLCRIVLSNMLFGTPVSFFYALLSGAAAYSVMLFISLNKNASAFIISVFGGIFHNIGQVAAAMIVFGSFSFIYYLPLLMLCGCISGAVIGFLCVLLLKNDNINKILKAN